MEARQADPTPAPEPASAVMRTSSLDPITRCVEALQADPRQTSSLVPRPHPLLCMVRREARVVLITVAATWDHGRDALRPFASRFAERQAMLILLSRPEDPDLSQALNKGLGSLLSENPSPDELYVALHNAFELMEMKSRSESRGKWLNR